MLACLGQYLRKIELDQKAKVSMESGEHTRPICVHNTTQAHKHKLEWIRDQNIYGISRTDPTFLSTYFTLSMQAGVHAPYVLVYTGPHLSQIGPDQRDQSIYGLRRTCQTSLKQIIWPEHASFHVLACIGLYFSHIGSNKRDQSIYGIRRTYQTSLSTKFDQSWNKGLL